MANGIFDRLASETGVIELGGTGGISQNPEIVIGYGAPPTAVQPSTGSIYLRRDAPNAAMILYVSAAGVWWPISATAFSDISVANEAALTAFDVSSLPDGARAYVATHRSEWTVRTQALTLQPHEIIASSSGNRQWVREPWSHLSWELQAAWFLDSVAGNDEADGLTNVTPIQTCAELWRRLGYGAQAVISQITTFTFAGTFATTDPLKLSIRLNGSAFLSFIGTVTITSAGQVVAKTDLARPTLANMTGQAGIAAFVGQRVTITSGASIGVNFWLERVIAGNQIETSSPIASMAVLPNTGIPVQTTITAGVGNNYQTETLSRIDSINLSLTVDNSIGTSPNFNIAYFQNLDFSQAANAPALFGPSVVGQFALLGCQTRPAAVQGPGSTGIYASCRMVPNTAFGGGTHFILAGMTIGTASTQTWQTETWVLYDQDHLMQACRLRMRRNGQVLIGTLCIQNATGDGFTAETDALPTKNATFLGGAHLLYGTGNSGVGITMGSAQSFQYVTTKPTLTGVGGDTKIGSVAVTAYANVPFVLSGASPENLAQINVAFP